MHTYKDTFRIMFQYARNEVKQRRAPSAFWAAEKAMDAYIEHFDWKSRADYRRIDEVRSAVLWAVHWTLFKPARKLKLWQSECRYEFSFGPNAEENYFRYPGPRLPG